MDLISRPPGGRSPRRRMLPILTALVVTAGFFFAAEGSALAAKSRTVKKNYTGFGGTTASDYPDVFVQDEWGEEAVGGAVLWARKSENRVSVKALDVTGLQAPIRVIYMKPGASESTALLECSGSVRGLKIQPRSAVGAFLVAGVCDDYDYVPAAPLRGTLTFTFSSAR